MRSLIHEETAPFCAEGYAQIERTVYMKLGHV